MSTTTATPETTTRLVRAEYDLNVEIIRDEANSQHVAALDLTDDPITAEGVRVLIRDLALLAGQLDVLNAATAP